MLNKLNIKAVPSGKAVRIIAAALSICALAACAGCSAQQLASEDEATVTASQYMISLNDASAELKQQLGEFASAATEQKISTMQAKLDEAYATLEKMANLEAPEELGELKAKYSDAVSQLKEALASYDGLYTDALDSMHGNAVDLSDYSEALESIQQQYDSALNALEEADEMAAQK